MVVGVLELTLYLPENHSLKGKRAVVRSVKSRVQSRFNVSVAEVDALDAWQTAVLGVAQVGNDRDHVDRCLREVATFVAGLGLAEPGRESYEFVNF